MTCHVCYSPGDQAYENQQACDGFCSRTICGRCVQVVKKPLGGVRYFCPFCYRHLNVGSSEVEERVEHNELPMAPIEEETAAARMSRQAVDAPTPTAGTPPPPPAVEPREEKKKLRRRESDQDLEGKTPFAERLDDSDVPRMDQGD